MDSTITVPQDSKLTSSYKEFHSLFWNLYCGVKIFSFRRSGIEQLSVSYDQFFLLLIFNGLAVLITAYLATPAPTFDLYGLGYMGAKLLVLLLMGYALAIMAKNYDRLPQFLIASYCVSPLIYLISYIGLPNLPNQFFEIYYVVLVWNIAVCFYIALILLDRQKLKAILFTTVWILFSIPLADISSNFWYEDPDYSEDGALANVNANPINQENVYYAQSKLLDNAIHPIEPGIKGTTDLFFVGFGSDASQDVFMKEVGHVQHAMDKHLGTSGRSAVLINNTSTIDATPLASASNLSILLNRIGDKMDLNEDVLFLYLTSHGSEDHELSVNMWPLNLNGLYPEHIKAYLDNAGIRWRIILVSACYSGGFIEPLKDEYSLILTAAASNKTSFGCANENEFTYFGEALFKDMDTGPYLFTSRFKQAITKISQRELSEDLIPSEPQLFVGNSMKEKLHQLERNMAQYPPVRFIDN